MKKPSFATMFAQFTDVWVAYDSKSLKVYGTGKSLSAAINRARKNGLPIPTVIKAPKQHLARIV